MVLNVPEMTSVEDFFNSTFPISTKNPIKMDGVLKISLINRSNILLLLQFQTMKSWVPRFLKSIQFTQKGIW